MLRNPLIWIIFPFLFPTFLSGQVPRPYPDSSGHIVIGVLIEDYRDPPNGASQKFDQELLDLHAHAPLAELLQEAPAVFVKSYGASGSSTPAFRGTGASHTQLYWNDIPINSPMLGLTDLSLGVTGMFDEVALVFGSASVAYGGGGLGGAILLDNDVSGSGLGISVGQEVASFGNLRSSVGVNWRNERWSTTTKASYIQGKNDFPFVDISRSEPLERELEHSALKQLSVLQQFSFSPNSRNTIIARAWLNGMDRELPPTMLTNNLTESQSDRSLRTMLEWKRRSEKAWNSSLIAAYFDEELVYENLLAGIFSHSRTHQAFLDFKIDKAFNTWLSYAGGIRLNAIRADSPGYPESISQNNATAFSHFRVAPAKKLLLGLMVRETVQAGDFSRPAVVLDGSYTFDRSRQKLYVNGGHNFRFPSFNDLYWRPGGNPNLTAEGAWSAELGLQQQYYNPSPKLWLRSHFSAYLSKVENMILWVPGAGSIWSAENVQSVFVRGAEASLKANWTSEEWEVQGEGSYAYTVSENRSGGSGNVFGKQLIYVPRHTGLIRLRLKRGKWRSVLSQQFTGMRFTTRDNSQELPRFSLGNIRLSREIAFRGGHLDLYSAVNNLWDISFQTIPWRPMPGRNYLLGLNLHWQKQ